jgi:hypothetical protein
MRFANADPDGLNKEVDEDGKNLLRIGEVLPSSAPLRHGKAW